MQRRGTSGLAAVLFTDIVSSTQIAGELGDRRWRELIRRHHAAVRQQLKRHHGRENDTAGDGFFATFERPADAIRAAAGAIAGVRELGIEIRAGVSFGEVEQHEGKAGGLVVVTAARVMSAAGPGQVLVPAVVADLIPGSGIRFGEHRRHALKGLDGEVVVRPVVEIDGEPLAPPLEAEEALERRAAIHPPPIHRRRGPRRLVAATAAAIGIAVVAGVASLLADDRARDGRPRALGSEWDVIAIDPAKPTRPVARVQARMEGGTIGSEFDRFRHTVAVGEQSVLVQRGECVFQIDPLLERTRNRFCPGGFDAAVALGAAWIVVDQTLLRLDLYSGEELQRVRIRAARDMRDVGLGFETRAVAIVVSGDTLWVGFADGIAARITPRTGEVSSYRAGEFIDSVAFGGGTLWAGDRFNGTIMTIDELTGEKGRIDLGSIRPDELTFDERSRKLWVLDAFADLLVSVDREGTGSRTIPVGPDPTDVAAGAGSLWVTDLDGVVRRVDPTTGSVEEVVDVGIPIWAVGIDEGTGYLWLDLAPPPTRLRA